MKFYQRNCILMIMLLPLISANPVSAKTTKHIAIASAQSVTPQSVEDYYLLLPPDYLSSIKDRSARRAAIKINDKKNGYIRAVGDGWEGYTEVALFRKPDGGALIGLSEVSFGPGVSQKFYFLEYSQGKWHDRTGEEFNKVPDATIRSVYRAKKSAEDDDYKDEVPQHVYLMPRYDTTIRVVTAPGFASREFTLAEFLWRSGKFVAATPKQPPDFADEWTGTNANISLTLKIEQSKNELTGNYSYVTLPNATRIREGRLEGFIRGNVAEVLFENHEQENERGNVKLTYDGAKLNWEITDAKEGNSLLPNRPLAVCPGKGLRAEGMKEDSQAITLSNHSVRVSSLAATACNSGKKCG